MPISPQDYELYSRMTGRPMPRDPEEKMRMAPEVYDFSRNFGREPNVLQKAGNLVGAIGKDIGGTLLSGIGYGIERSNQLADTQQQQEFELEKERIRAGAKQNKAEDILRNFAEKEKIKTDQRMRRDEGLADQRMRRDEGLAGLKKDIIRTKGEETRKDIRARQNRENDMQNVTDGSLDTDFEFVGYDPSSANIESNDFESPGEVLNQPIVNNQTGTNILGRVTKQGAELTQNPTVADSLTNNQTPNAVNLPDVDLSRDDQPFTTDVSNDPTGTKGFLKNSILNNSDLVDNPDEKDVIGGEDDANVPGQKQNFDNTYLETDFSKRMENNERARAELRDIPSMKNPAFAPTDKRDRARSDFDMNDPEVRQEYAKLRSNKGLLGLKNEILEGMAIGNIAKQYQDARRREGTEGALDDIPVVTTSDKADDFLSSFAPQSILRTGEMGGKAKGIEINPSPNGDPTIGFAVDSKEGTAKYTYPAPPNILESIADTEREDSLGRKKFNYLFRMAGRGEEGIGEGTKEVFPRII